MIKDIPQTCFWLFLSFIHGLCLSPRLFQFPVNMKWRVNGSSETGHCTSLVGNVCHNTTSSVLFDGIIPTLTGLDGDMWATELLTIPSNFNLAVSFSETPGFAGVRRVEIVLFNCPEWGISVQSITLRASTSFAGFINPTVTSCDSLVRVCIGNFTTNHAGTEFTLGFTHIKPSNWVHIAEMTFYADNSTCLDDIITSKPTQTSGTVRATPSANTSPTAHMNSPNAGAIAGGVVAAFLAVITTIMAVITILTCLTRPKDGAGEELPPPNGPAADMNDIQEESSYVNVCGGLHSASETVNSPTLQVYAVVDELEQQQQNILTPDESACDLRNCTRGIPVADHSRSRCMRAEISWSVADIPMNTNQAYVTSEAERKEIDLPV